MHFIDPYHRYIHYSCTIKTVIKYQEMATSAFPHSFVLAVHTEKPVQMVWDLLGGFNRMAWIQSISQTLALSSVVVCDWCDCLFGIWLELGVPLV